MRAYVDSTYSIGYSRKKVESVLIIMTTIWFFVILNSYIVWNQLAPIIHLLPSCVIVLYTMSFFDCLIFSKDRRRVCLLMSVFMIWIILTLCDDFSEVIKRMTDYVPMLFVVFWPKELLLKTYLSIKKIIIFFSIGSSVVTVLVLLGLHGYLPHFTLPAREALHVRLGLVYNVYILFVTIFNPVTGIVTPRACGMLQEPGHFAILLGLIYLIERTRKVIVNKWIIICGILTFSSAFILIVFFTDFYKLFSKSFFRKIVLFLLLFSVFSIIVYSYLPVEVKEQIEYLIYGRNLEQIIESFKTSSSLIGALDERASDISVANYEKISFTEYLFGGGHVDKGFSLSDYRGMIIDIGVMGMAFSILLYLVIISSVSIRVKVSLSFVYLLIIIHRSWMLYDPYVYILAFFVVVLCDYKILDRTCSNYSLSNA